MALPTLPSKTGLLIIDVQKAFEDPSWGPRNNPQAESNVARLLEGWRHSQRPIYHVQHHSRSPTGLFRQEKPGFAFKAEAQPRTGEPIYIKDVNSAFIGTSLEADLRAAGVETVVIVGLTTIHCVSTTTRMSGNLGFQTYLVQDATAAFERKALDGTMRPAESVHLAALSDLNEEFATIVTTDQVLEAL